jgi:hypothetical protein
MIDAAGRKIREPEVWRLMRRSVFVPFAHGAMMYRREVFERAGGYREECEYWEDQDLVVRMAAIAKVAVIPSPLYQVRQWTTSTRAASNQERLERALNRVYQVTDGLKKKEDYDGLFDGQCSDPRKLDPRVFIALGSVRLWAGGKPRLFRRTISRAQLSCNFKSASALVWTAWASASPSSLRAFMRFLVTARNRFGFQPLSTERPLVWQPLRAAEPLGQIEGKA